MRIYGILPVAALCALAVSMQAQSGPGKCPPYPNGGTYDASPIVNAIDTNHDGKMTKKEWDAAGAPDASWNFFMSKYPQDKKNGYITRKQFLAAAPPNGIDTNCDGKITIQEFRATKKWKMGGGPGGAPPKGGAPGKAPAPGHPKR